MCVLRSLNLICMLNKYVFYFKIYDVFYFIFNSKKNYNNKQRGRLLQKVKKKCLYIIVQTN